MTPEELDRDPVALAWARSYIQAEIDRIEAFEQAAIARGDVVTSVQWHRHAALLKRKFIGGEGCTITAFDERRPRWLAALDLA